ncbi:hypothetical protein lerEdw1_000022 [Lerista edwardsae]|nr:hypothetical protein lerEdw1_000022 [Lerista edwardsae]
MEPVTGLSFEESLHALDKAGKYQELHSTSSEKHKAARAVQVEDDSQQTEKLEELLEGVPFKPHVYTVRITEPPIQTPEPVIP